EVGLQRLRSAHRVEDGARGDALVDVERDHIHLEARVLGLAGILGRSQRSPAMCSEVLLALIRDRPDAAWGILAEQAFVDEPQSCPVSSVLPADDP
ncbi:MAG: hypothetical protein RMJ47_07360, partial [Bacteroidota bacterium]|nr:hypothetical protein [Bacteroidota bacterium]